MQNPGDISNPTTAFNMALALMAKAFTLNDTTPTNNNQRSSSNPSSMQIAQPGMNMDQDRQMLMVEDNVGNQFRPNAMQNVRNQVVLNASQNPGVQNVGNQNALSVVLEIAYQHGMERKLDAAYLQKQMQIAQKEEAGIQLTSEEFDFMAAVGACKETKRANANCTLENNLQQASSSGTQSDKAPSMTQTDQLRMTLDTHNWSSSAHQEIHKILKEEIFPIVNQVDARLQNFEIQFLKEAAKFVRDFKSLANEADESLAKHKALELEIKRLLRAVVNQDIMLVCKIHRL
ncbi:hypothetical protein Tco_0451565 [Tanacetum coccineum]